MINIMTGQPNPIIHAPGVVTVAGEAGEVKVHHVDVLQYGMAKVCSVVLFETPEAIAIVDTGTSEDVRKIVRYMKKHGLALDKVRYLVPSHFHFDHFGGGWQAWERIVPSNPDVKVLTTAATRDQLQDAAAHLTRAARTFGADFVGEMRPLPDHAYEIVAPGTRVPLPGAQDGDAIMLVPSPGHCADHVCPTLVHGDEVPFTFLGEAGGTLFHSSKLVTFGTSMPPEYNFDAYVRSLERLVALDPAAVGYCHFGIVRGRDHVREVMRENLAFTRFFKEYVEEGFKRTGSVRAVVEAFVRDEAPARTDWPAQELLVKILVALVYGQLVDLGLKPPK